MKKISIIVPCYNEEKNIREMYSRVKKVMIQLSEYDYELIFIDNASKDNSQAIFHELAQRDHHLHVLLMSRNFGSNQPSILAGLRYVSGDCMVILAGDLQDPPELIPEFVKKWEDGFDVVYGTMIKRKASLVRRIGYACFYPLFKKLSYLEIPLNSGDFSLIDAKVINVIKQLPEKDLYIRGLRTWAGFKQGGVEYVREERFAGKSNESFLSNCWWAKQAIFNFSYKPLEFLSFFSIVSCIATCFAAIFYLFLHFKYGAPKGFSTLLMATFIFGSIQLLAISVIGEYLMRIFQEVKGRPAYIVREILHREQLTASIKTTMEEPKKEINHYQQNESQS